jgi:uncharacterized phage protein (TIGR02218 family)
MRTIGSELRAHLDGDATTVCHAWRVTRSDGVVLGFSEHDHDLTFTGTVFLAASGFSASGTEENTGLPAATSEVTGGFSNAAISEADLQRGLYDGARVEVFLVNWAMPDQHLLLKVQEIGEVTRSGGQFRAELRSFAHRLNQPQGRLYGRRCDAALGDARCGIDVTQSQFCREGVLAAVIDATRISVSGLSAFPDGFFRYGTIAFLDGENAGERLDIEAHGAAGAEVEVTLWLPVARAPDAGCRVLLTAGCDKAFGTCRAKFANQRNFRGFPHMPGADFAYTYADGGSIHDGSALFK